MPDTIVHWFWAIMILLTFGSVAYFANSAWRSKPADALYWRGVRLFASALGMVGLFLLLLNFEQLVRTSMVDRADDYAFKTFLETNFYSTFNAAVACGGLSTTSAATSPSCSAVSPIRGWRRRTPSIPKSAS